MYHIRIESCVSLAYVDGIQVPKSSKPRNAYAIRLQCSLYGLKQSERMWYTRLSEYLIGKGYKNDELCPCVFIKHNSFGFARVCVYVNDMNIIGSLNEDMGNTRFCLGLEFEHRVGGILVHQSAYIRKMPKRLCMDKVMQPASTPMVVRSLDTKKDPFRPKDDDEEILGPEYPYLSAI